MKKLEDIIVDKLAQIIHNTLLKIIKPDMQINTVCEIDEKAILTLKKIYGIEGIILDVDETLRSNMNNIPNCNQTWLKSLRGHFKVIIVSNGIDNSIKSYFEQQKIHYISFACKPLKKNFLAACQKMNLEPNQVLVIGNNLFSDIYGGIRNNMKTALVNSVEKDER